MSPDAPRHRRRSLPVVWAAALSVLAAVSMAFVMPMGYVEDEPQHAFRAYEISQGHVLPNVRHLAHAIVPADPLVRVGDRIPVALRRVLAVMTSRKGLHEPTGPFQTGLYARHRADPLAAGRTAFVHFENTALYSPVVYAPQAAAFWAGRQLGLSVLWLLFVARLAAGLTWAALVTASVALVARRWQWPWTMAVLIPTAFAQGASLSADAVTLGVCAVELAAVCRLVWGGSTPGTAALAGLAGWGVLVGLLKPPLVLLVVFGAVALGVRNTTGLRGWVRAAATAVPGCAAGVAWSVAIAGSSSPYRPVAMGDGSHVDAAAQLGALARHLERIPGLLWETQQRGLLVNPRGIFGTIGTTTLWPAVAVAWLVALAALIACLERGPRPRLVPAAAVACAVALTLATALLIYGSWSPVGSAWVQGLQGRYTTPFVLLLFPACAGLLHRRLRLPPRAPAVVAMAVTTAGLLATWQVTAHHFYGLDAWQLPQAVGLRLF